MLSTAEDIRHSGNEAAIAEPAIARPRRLFLIRPRVQQQTRTEQARRALNVVVAAIGLVVSAPLLLIIAAAIKLTSPGPVFYTQLRVGVDRRTSSGGNWRRRFDYGGRLFTIYKFRTMTTEQPATEVWATPTDPRVTAVGAFLRKYRLDELPQLVNVLKGDMNVVGPRPEQPTIFATLREQVDDYPARQRVLPGITGWAQINQSYDRCLDDVRKKVKLDLEYLQSASVTNDLRILARTVPTVLMKKGAW